MSEKWTAGYPDGSGPDTILDEKGESVAVTSWGCGCCSDGPNAESIALAELIVRAVNSHEALLEACEAFVAAHDRHWEVNNQNIGCPCEHCKTFRAAIRLAKEGA